MTHFLVSDATASWWEQTIYAFLAEKERRSGQFRRVQTYSWMVFQFFMALGKAADEVTFPEVFSYAHIIGTPARSLPRSP